MLNGQQTDQTGEEEGGEAHVTVDMVTEAIWYVKEVLEEQTAFPYQTSKTSMYRGKAFL